MESLIVGTMWIVPLVVSTLTFPERLRDDLEQEGYLGLVEASRRFRPDRGARLATYATYWIRMRAKELLVKEVRHSRVHPEYLKTIEEEGVSDLLMESQEPTPLEITLREEWDNRYNEAMASLPPVLFRMIFDYYFRGWSLLRVGQRHHVNPEKVPRVLQLTLKLLRRRLESR